MGPLYTAQENFAPNDDLDFAQVQYVKMTEKSNGTWSFDVTVRHKDSGWDHYADLWLIVNPKNEEILGKRVLAHPHVNEQPFSRSLSNVSIGDNIKMIEIRAKCNIHGFEGKRVLVDLEETESDDYSLRFYN